MIGLPFLETTCLTYVPCEKLCALCDTKRHEDGSQSGNEPQRSQFDRSLNICGHETSDGGVKKNQPQMAQIITEKSVRSVAEKTGLFFRGPRHRYRHITVPDIAENFPFTAFLLPDYQELAMIRYGILGIC
jgi:hypothetical protein